MPKMSKIVVSDRFYEKRKTFYNIHSPSSGFSNRKYQSLEKKKKRHAAQAPALRDRHHNFSHL